jgi:hypothetical protein
MLRHSEQPAFARLGIAAQLTAINGPVARELLENGAQ